MLTGPATEDRAAATVAELEAPQTRLPPIALGLLITLAPIRRAVRFRPGDTLRYA